MRPHRVSHRSGGVRTRTLNAGAVRSARMRHAAITGWGEGLPDAVLSNDDLATFLETSDEWITSRTGMKERRVSHVSAVELASVASLRALACAGLDPAEVELIMYGSCSNDEGVPNSASGVQVAIGATR